MNNLFANSCSYKIDPEEPLPIIHPAEGSAKFERLEPRSYRALPPLPLVPRRRGARVPRRVLEEVVGCGMVGGAVVGGKRDCGTGVGGRWDCGAGVVLRGVCGTGVVGRAD